MIGWLIVFGILFLATLICGFGLGYSSCLAIQAWRRKRKQLDT